MTQVSFYLLSLSRTNLKLHNIALTPKLDKKFKIVESGLWDKGITIRIGGFPVQIPLGAQPLSETHPHYEASSDLWVKILQMQWWTWG